MALNQALLFPMDVFQIQGDTIQRIASGTATASITVNSAGTISVSGTSLFAVTYPYNWKTPTSGSTGFFVRATLLSEGGTGLTSGSFDTWDATTANRTWSVFADNPPSDHSAQILIEIARDSGGTNIVASAEITLFAEAF